MKDHLFSTNDRLIFTNDRMQLGSVASSHDRIPDRTLLRSYTLYNCILYHQIKTLIMLTIPSKRDFINY